MKRKLITMILAAVTVATSATLSDRADTHGKVQLWEGDCKIHLAWIETLW